MFLNFPVFQSLSVDVHLGGHLKVYYIGGVGLLNPLKSSNLTTITSILQDHYRILNTYRTEQKIRKLDVTVDNFPPRNAFSFKK